MATELASYSINANQWGEDSLVIFDDNRIALYWEDRKENTGGIGHTWTWARFLAIYGDSQERGYRQAAKKLRELMAK